ncbi:hypothetical protein ZIOFF_053706 [Zingiber officinale]|uniref:Uncharacterized protein n=1 Tax=Zingiber officinale TaxID=94328 RepID=A0A8J5FCW6_ZINOF|nr:hypothetical protein ZIOFF_053706 [Zingiber officinale]
MVHCPFIRKSINNIFYQFIFETGRHSGIVELLEILGSIINGFALLMKEEHKLFLVRALIPLHQPKSIGVYHQQLSYCIVQFVEKDYNLVAQNCTVILPIIFEALEKNMQSHWNQSVHGLTANIRKMFLDMYSDLFEMCQQQYLDNEDQAKYSEEQRELAWRSIEAVELLFSPRLQEKDIFLDEAQWNPGTLDSTTASDISSNDQGGLRNCAISANGGFLSSARISNLAEALLHLHALN